MPENGRTLAARDATVRTRLTDLAKWVLPLLVTAVKLHTQRQFPFIALKAIAGFLSFMNRNDTNDNFIRKI